MSNPLPVDGHQNLNDASSQSHQGVVSQQTGQVRVKLSQIPLPSQPSTQPQAISGVAKEKKEIGSPLQPEPEKVPITEFREPEPSKEVEGWVERLEKGEDIQLPQPVTDDFGQILVSASTPQKPEIVLPLNEKQVEEGVKHKVVESIRWLAEWCLRVIKLAHGRVFYKKNN